MAPSIFGYEVVSELPLSRLADGPAPRGRLSLVRADRQLLDVDGELISWQETDAGEHWVAFARSRDGLLGACSQSGAFLIDPNRARLHVQPRNGADKIWQHRIIGTALPLLASELGDLVLHACAVVSPSGAVVFCGPSGRGKSTLALHLANAGHPVLAEDGVAIDVGEERPVAWPGPDGIRVADGPGEAKRLHAITQGLRVTSPAPVLAAVALAARTSGELSVERLDPVTGARAVLASTISTPGPDFAGAFAGCARLAERVPVFRARLPEGLERAETAAPALLAQVTRAAGV